ncbi:MAG: TonB-dependent receptor [Sphingobacterium sp.]|nr:TonB-dependent receptor [Sphingobacterium sp.]
MTKLTALFLIFGMLQLSNAALAQKISLSEKNASLAKVFKKISQQSGYGFMVEGSLLKSAKPVTINVENEELEKVLSAIFTGQPLKFEISDQSVIVSGKQEEYVHTMNTPRLSKAISQQNGRISGKVVNDRGEPLPGASVKILQNNQAIQSSVDGTYNFSIAPGNYTIEITYISFQPKRVTQLEVKSGQTTSLNIVLNPATNELSQVLVSGDYKKASVAALYSQQKNRAAISNGISAEQIAATPDRNVGETLKRISGVNTADNKFVLVRGIGERYNAAMLDGTALPSTEAQKRSFSFDMIPNAIVDNVVVVKTVTPDMNTSFGGGAIQISTKDIPTENFITFGIGTSINDQSIGKDFLSRKRGRYDYLGFDDGRRDFPKDLKTMSSASPIEELVEQSKRFKNDNFTVYKYKAVPSQNYQFTIGRLFELDTAGQCRFGITGALNYRNSQTIHNIDEIRRGKWNTNTEIAAGGLSYNYNTTLGGILNMGLQLGRHRFSLRNTYTHLFDNSFTRIKGVSSDNNFNGMPDQIRETDDPTFTTLLQNKLSGMHQLKKVKLEWDFARTGIDRKQKDIGIATQAPQIIGTDTLFLYLPNQLSEPRFTPVSRQHYSNSETQYAWAVSASRPFDFGSFTNTVKMGYSGTDRQARFDWKILPVVVDNAIFDPSLRYIPISDWLKPENIRPDGYMLLMDGWGNDYYAGKSQNHAGYAMLDNKLNEKWRLVWGLRAEYYDYRELNNGSNAPKPGANGEFQRPEDKKWQWLPSANLTYSPAGSLNIRAAYSSTVVRPEMMDNSQFFRYSVFYDGLVGSQGISSTRVNSWDFKAEWFPGLGEVLSIGGYYKHFDKPAEMIAMETNDFGFRYTLKNSNWAKVYGLEIEARKSLAFISEVNLLKNLTVYGNLTLQQSRVEGLYPFEDPNTKEIVMAPMKQKRALYGQAPYLLNAGLQYQDEKFGVNVVYNKSGRKTYFVTTSPANTEYEQPREQLDAQISYKLLKSRLEVRMNGGNLLNAASVFYNNRGSYEINPDNTPGSLDFSNAQRLKEGFTDNYEEGDLYTFKQHFGRTFSASLVYKF